MKFFSPLTSTEMIYRLLALTAVLTVPAGICKAQVFSSDGFSVDVPCAMEKVMEAPDGEGGVFKSYQCVIQVAEGVGTIYRVNIVDHQVVITDSDTFYSETAVNYRALGQESTIVSYRDEKATESKTVVNIQGLLFHQWSLTILDQSLSYTLVLVTNAPNTRNDFNTLTNGFELE